MKDVTILSPSIKNTVYLIERQKEGQKERGREKRTRRTERERESSRDRELPASRLVQVEARRWELNPDSPHGLQEFSHWSHHLLPPQVLISRKPEYSPELELEPIYSDMWCLKPPWQMLTSILAL